jgi:hypothetical protein
LAETYERTCASAGPGTGSLAHLEQNVKAASIALSAPTSPC